MSGEMTATRLREPLALLRAMEWRRERTLAGSVREFCRECGAPREWDSDQIKRRNRLRPDGHYERCLLAQVIDALAAETARADRLIDGIGRIAERRRGMCPLCDQHWNWHRMDCPIRSAQPDAAREGE